jgi:hypothetical protein
MLRKKKLCKSCGKVTYLFSKEVCKQCYMSSYAANYISCKQSLSRSDDLFYRRCWEQMKHECINCGCELFAPSTFGIRIYFHHILPKSKYPQFRHDVRNIAILCADCHACAESAISYPKMNVYEQLEKIKLDLLKQA